MPSSMHARPLKVLRKADGSAASQSSMQLPLEKSKRKVIYNACEGCRSSKTKCSGEHPCTRCVKYEIDCVFTGRAHERTRQELLTSQDDLAGVQDELQKAQNKLANLQQELAACQNELTLSQSNHFQCEQLAKLQKQLMTMVFDVHRGVHQRSPDDLRNVALGSRNADDFCRNLAVLPGSPFSAPTISNSLNYMPFDSPSTPSGNSGRSASSSLPSSGSFTNPPQLQPIMDETPAYHDPGLIQHGAYPNVVDNIAPMLADYENNMRMARMDNFLLLPSNYSGLFPNMPGG